MTPPNAPLVFVDVETDGLHVDRKVWDIGMIRRDPDGTLTEEQFFVHISLHTADPFGLSVGGFYDRHPLGKWIAAGTTNPTPNPPPTPSSDGPYLTTWEAAYRVAQFTHDAHLVGSVPSFDAQTLDRFLRDHQLTPSWHYHLIDVEIMAVGWLAGRSDMWLQHDDPHKATSLPWKSDALSRACGVAPPTPEERHTAIGDARWAMRLFDHITQEG